MAKYIGGCFLPQPSLAARSSARRKKGVAEVRVVGVGRVVVLSGASLVVPMIVFETKKLGADERGSRHDAADKCGRGCRDQ
jgi:hypothetical protein